MNDYPQKRRWIAFAGAALAVAAGLLGPPAAHAQGSGPFRIQKDPMNDKPTYTADIVENDSGTISFHCGDATGRNLWISAKQRKLLIADRSGFGGSFATKIRFDDRAPIDIRISYGDYAGLIRGDKQVGPLIDQMLISSRIVLELTGHNGADLYIAGPITDDARAAVREVVTRCGYVFGKK